MEVAPKSISPHLQRVLKSFQTTATRSLQGPGPTAPIPLTATEMAKITSEEYRKALVKKFSSEKGDCESFRVPPPFPVQQNPVFTPVDAGRSEKTDTILEGESIACFLVGGEKRLCLPQILNTVLRDFTLPQINTVCDELHIFCSRCNPDQLDILKVTGILPLSAPSCGLITKTDAERLCNALLHRFPDKTASHISHNSFKVYHECFGKCKGVFDPDLYNSPDSRCVQCVDCGGWFGPQKFVGHSHKAQENRTCHWGFDSANWRYYIHLAKDQGGREKLQEVLEQIKSRFDNNNKYKRKQILDSIDADSAKRSKSEDSSSPTSSVASWVEQTSTLRAMMSAFQPWSPSVATALKEGKLLPAPPAIMTREGFAGMVPPPYLHSGPPVLLHPDKVVPHSESSRYEPNYAPNVSLAPAPKQKVKSEDDEGDLEKKPAQSPEPGPSKPYKEWDLVSESDDSSIERLSPSDGEDTQAAHKTLEAELDMIRCALDGEVGESKEEKEKFLQEFCKLRARHEEVLNQSVQARRNLKQELSTTKSSTKELLQVASDKTCKLEKDLERVRRESDSRLQEAVENKEKLLKDVKARQEREDIEMTKMIQVNQELQTRLKQYEIAYEQLRCENILMQEKLHQVGVNVLELISKHSMNGTLKPTKSPSRSPQRSPTETGLSPRQRLLLGPLHGIPLELLTVKSEREVRDT